jgi:hypothetical protein
MKPEIFASNTEPQPLVILNAAGIQAISGCRSVCSRSLLTHAVTGNTLGHELALPRFAVSDMHTHIRATNS